MRPLNRCAEDTASLMELLTTLAGSVQRDRSLADKLKQDTAKALQNAEIAQRTHDTPAGLQYENNAPLLFFMELAESFEQDLLLFRSQIESTEKHIHTMVTPKTLTPQGESRLIKSSELYIIQYFFYSMFRINNGDEQAPRIPDSGSGKITGCTFEGSNAKGAIS